MKQSYKFSDIIVRAKVISLNDTAQYDIFSNLVYPPFKKGSNPKLKVSKLYKGRLTSKEIDLVSYHTLCDYYFEPNKEYIVFISRIDGKLETSVCAHNFKTTDITSFAEFKKIDKEK